MALVTYTGAQVAPVFPDQAEVYPALAGTAIVLGAAYNFNTTTGRLAAVVAGTVPFHGIAMKAAGVGQATDLLIRGHVAGFNLTNVVYGGTVYAGGTAGEYSDAPIGGTVPVGICVPLSDSDRTKVLYVKAQSWEA
jgi:hypothetical protein